MTDVFSPEKRSSVMRRVRSRNTGPELKVRKALTGMGLRYRLHRKDLPGAPDIVMPGRRLAIFIHGCFWHGHDCARGARVPKANQDYWLAKISRNRARDIRNLEALTSLGWRVVVLWECEMKPGSDWPGRLETQISELASGQRMTEGDGVDIHPS